MASVLAASWSRFQFSKLMEVLHSRHGQGMQSEWKDWVQVHFQERQNVVAGPVKDGLAASLLVAIASQPAGCHGCSAPGPVCTERVCMFPAARRTTGNGQSGYIVQYLSLALIAVTVMSVGWPACWLPWDVIWCGFNVMLDQVRWQNMGRVPWWFAFSAKKIATGNGSGACC